MDERRGISVPLEELFARLVKVETPGNKGLVAALEKIGYEMTSDVRKDCRIIWIHARFDIAGAPAPAVALALTSNGFLHAPEYDQTQAEVHSKAKLVTIKIEQYEPEINFAFVSLANPNKKFVIKLKTIFNRQVKDLLD